ncbi:MAG: DUF1684 domain-containing protein [Cyclobacteriaceae bacterium]
MKLPKFTLLIIAGALSIISIYVFSGSSQQGIHREKIAAYWKAYNLFLVNSSSSPVENKNSFSPINYFEPNINFLITADVVPLSTSESLELFTNTGEQKTYIKYALLKFSIGKQPFQLTLLQNSEDKNDYFLPFSDITSGKTTYPSGRYLAIDFNSLNKVTLDFNEAKNPYCAYNSSYSCPIPPRENFLNIEVRAGEQYH